MHLALLCELKSEVATSFVCWCRTLRWDGIRRCQPRVRILPGLRLLLGDLVYTADISFGSAGSCYFSLVLGLPLVLVTVVRFALALVYQGRVTAVAYAAVHW